uniref:Uncharacterized protein n=1 Tax=Cyanothece sp. (strain PCC 7425 / ATCC 29141) TaxID=395961 RepID=B8HSL6_CYAP4
MKALKSLILLSSAPLCLSFILSSTVLAGTPRLPGHTTRGSSTRPVLFTVEWFCPSFPVDLEFVQIAPGAKEHDIGGVVFTTGGVTINVVNPKNGKRLNNLPVPGPIKVSDLGSKLIFDMRGPQLIGIPVEVTQVPGYQGSPGGIYYFTGKLVAQAVPDPGQGAGYRWTKIDLSTAAGRVTDICAALK